MCGNDEKMEKYGIDYFIGKSWSFILIKNNKIIFRSKSRGLAPLVFCLKKYKKEMKGAVVFDKTIGRAAAMLLVYGKAQEVWTPIISENGLKYLQKNKIKAVYQNKVKNILNQKGDDLCPMEKMSRNKNIKEICHFFSIK